MPVNSPSPFAIACKKRIPRSFPFTGKRFFQFSSSVWIFLPQSFEFAFALFFLNVPLQQTFDMVLMLRALILYALDRGQVRCFFHTNPTG